MHETRFIMFFQQQQRQNTTLKAQKLPPTNETRNKATRDLGVIELQQIQLPFFSDFSAFTVIIINFRAKIHINIMQN